jgi:hypothetical protein
MHRHTPMAGMLLALLACNGGGSTAIDAAGSTEDGPGAGGATGIGGATVLGTGGSGTTGGAIGPGTGGSATAGGASGERTDGGRDASRVLDAVDDETAPLRPATCAPWPASSGKLVNVTPAQAGTLHELVLNATAGTTFLLAPGSYAIAGSLRLEQANLTVRSSTDRASDVTIDAAYSVAEAVVIRASNAAVAHVTITRAVDHAIHVSPPNEGVDVTGLVLYGVALTDNGEQFLKVNPLGSAAGYIDGGRVECSTFLLTDAGRPHIERSTGGCYTGGIDVHAGRDWVVRNNRFEGIYCAGEGLAEHAVHFWKRSRGTLVENNVIVNCARGIGLGMGDADTGTRVYTDAPYGGDLGHIDGIVRNNIIYSDIDYFDTGIEIIQARQPRVVHNTIVSWIGAGFFSSIDYRFGRTQAVIQNNLVRRITARDSAKGTVDHNLENTPEAYLVSPKQGDFHLTLAASDAIDRGTTVAEAGVDLDGEQHVRGAPDIGADER